LHWLRIVSWDQSFGVLGISRGAVFDRLWIFQILTAPLMHVAELAIDPADPQARTNLAGALFREGRIDEAIAQLEGAGGGTVAKLLDHEDPYLRGAALFAYFGQPRDDSELPRVIELLNSPTASPAQKRTFISLLAQRNTDLFDSLFAGAETSIADPQVKEALRRTAAAVARQKARKAEAAAKKARGDGGAPPPVQAPEGSTPQ
jgi:hypothetical protein